MTTVPTDPVPADALPTGQIVTAVRAGALEVAIAPEVATLTRDGLLDIGAWTTLHRAGGGTVQVAVTHRLLQTSRAALPLPDVDDVLVIGTPLRTQSRTGRVAYRVVDRHREQDLLVLARIA